MNSSLYTVVAEIRCDDLFNRQLLKASCDEEDNDEDNDEEHFETEEAGEIPQRRERGPSGVDYRPQNS